jgi:hypothetical protein
MDRYIYPTQPSTHLIEVDIGIKTFRYSVLEFPEELRLEVRMHVRKREGEKGKVCETDLCE